MIDINSETLDAEIEADGAKIVRDGFKPGDLAVVTGAARGFGRAIARRLAREGAKLALWDLIDAEGEETAALCRDAGAAEARFFHCDMADARNVAAAAKGTADALGTPFVVVNNAGINLRAPALEYTLEMWQRTLNVNLIGSFLTTQAFMPAMIAAKRGCVINLASGRAVEGAVKSIAYGASKAGIVNMTKTMADEWGTHGIRVNAIIPGASETRQPLESGTSLEELRARGEGVPLGRVGHPDDIAGMVMLLLTADAAFITGQSIAINGGKIKLP